MDDLRRAQIIEEGLASEFWREILLPLFTERKLVMEMALKNPKMTRKHDLPDDYCRGQLDLAELALDQPTLLAETIRNAQVEEQLNEQRERRDDLIAHTGWGRWNVEE